MDLGAIAFWILMAIFGVAVFAATGFGCICFVGYMVQHQYDPPISREEKKRWWMTAAVVVLSIAVAIGRLTIETRHNIPTWPLSYEAFAHLWIGGLIGSGLVTKSWLYWWPLILLTAWEVVAFLFL